MSRSRSGTRRMRRWLRPVVVLFGARAAAAFVVAYPTVRALAGHGAPFRPEGDSALFAPGGLLLLESVRLGGATLWNVAEASTLIALALSALLLFPFGLALAALEAPDAPLAASARRAWEWFPRFVLLGGITLLLQGVVTAAAGGLGALAAGLADHASDERVRALSAAAIWAAGGAIVCMLGALLDLSRAAIARGDESLWDAAAAALRGATSAPGRTVLAFLGILLAEAAIVTVAARAALALDVHRPGFHRLVLVFIAHQSAVFALSALRLTWLARCLDLVPKRATDDAAP